MTLDTLNINQSAIVTNLNCTSELRRRLLDLGIVPNTNITAVFTSPFGNPVAYQVRGSIIALRKEDSKFIKIEI